MRFFYGAAAFVLWSGVLLASYLNGVYIRDDIAIITYAIVIAGAMAGGD